jgi:hypothetical protein
MFPQIEYKEKQVVICFNGGALEYLQSIYRDPTQEQHTRMRAASLAIAYESPKLVATAVLDGKDFGAILDKRVAHWRKVDSLPRVPTPPVEVKRALPHIYDKRYRRI